MPSSTLELVTHLETMLGLLFCAIHALPTTTEASASGTIYVIRHAETDGHSKDCGISAEGILRAEYLPSIFKNGGKFKAPATIIAFQVHGTKHGQRMEDTVTPLAKSLGLNITKGPTLIDDPNWTPAPAKAGAAQALAALNTGAVLVSDWSYVSVFCKELGKSCKHLLKDGENFQGNDQVCLVQCLGTV